MIAGLRLSPNPAYIIGFVRGFMDTIQFER